MCKTLVGYSTMALLSKTLFRHSSEIPQNPTVAGVEVISVK